MLTNAGTTVVCTQTHLLDSQRVRGKYGFH